ncbi:hypothetical protein Leryth_025140 [Lithospermum erythrorhizon]|nr:hypothetical protein Leryth_025140 [Lithospermum erythrorhizon]
MLLNITSKQVPTSAKTAAQTSGWPAMANATMAALVEIASTIFSITFVRTLLPSRTALGIFRISLDIRITFPVSVASAEPETPMDMPISATAKAGASFRPGGSIGIPSQHGSLYAHQLQFFECIPHSSSTTIRKTENSNKLRPQKYEPDRLPLAVKSMISKLTSSDKDLKSVTVNSPLVIVPVLSKAMILILERLSRYSAPLNRRPEVAAFESAQNIATGVERIRAHGHALTKTTKASRYHCF